MSESGEFKLVVALTHPLAEQQNQLEDIIVSGSINWEKFLSLVSWHRVTPQVYRNLANFKANVPAAIFEKLREETLSSQRVSLQQSARLLKISKQFKINQVQFIALKGVALSQQLYGDSGRRESKDIDILIDIEDINMAEQILTKDLGYIRTQPALDISEDELNFSNQSSKDRIYRHTQDNTEIELHWRFTAEKPLLSVPFSKLVDKSVSLKFHDQNIMMLDNDYLWLYQSFHGTYSGWYRLHWVSDIAELLAHHQPADWDNLLQMAEKYHCRKCLLEAVVLTGQVYQLPIPELINLQMQKSWQRHLSMPLALDALFKAKFMSPFWAMWRAIFWLPQKYYLIYILLKMVQTPRGSADWYKDKPIRVFVYKLLRPATLLIRRVL